MSSSNATALNEISTAAYTVDSSIFVIGFDNRNTSTHLLRCTHYNAQQRMVRGGTQQEPRTWDGRSVLLIGSGPIQIGQAAEFDYSGAQACRALKEEGIRVVLVNSNPATIMTDPDMADAVYIEPITTDAIAEIIRKEQPDGVIAGVGGQTGLNVTAELSERGILEEYDVDILGTPLETIYATEDRKQFRERMQAIDQPMPRSVSINDVADLTDAVESVGGLPVIMRTTYTLGGSGSGVIDEMDELRERVRRGLRLSRNNEVLITESIAGWIELEYEVMRDADNSCIIICNMENLDPMGIHTGESIVVTPSQVIPDAGHQQMRSAALEVIRDLEIHGGCNIQFAWRDDGTPTGEYRVVEVNPRVSRSSALASKATGYPIARVTAKVALGKRLHEIDNEITGETTAAFEPAIDYVVTKVPRWPKDKFPEVSFDLGPAMKSTGEAMAIGRTFEESFLKAIRSTEYVPLTPISEVTDEALRVEYLQTPTPDRSFAIIEAFRRGIDIETISTETGIHRWYLERIERIATAIDQANGGDIELASHLGFTDIEIEAMRNGVDPFVNGRDHIDPTALTSLSSMTPARSYKQVDTCAGEFAASTPYYYSAREPTIDRSFGFDLNEVQVDLEAESVVIVGGGPIRIGQGIEFDYCTVHAIRGLQELGIHAHVVNNNPETVSTDYDTSDALFFEPITAEEVADVIEATGADGVMLQFGGQTSVDIARPLLDEVERRGLDCSILGTSVDAMDLAENRDRFNALLRDHGIQQPRGGTATNLAEAKILADEIGYPVLVRPSYVLGGRAMDIVYGSDELESYVNQASAVSPDHPILIDEFLEDAIELDVEAVSDGEDVLIGGIMEHIEPAGIHSGDSACVIPPRSLDVDVLDRVREVTETLARLLNTVGLLNVQLAILDGEVYVIEANPRSSRTVPFVSKATGVPIAKAAAAVQLGRSLDELPYAEAIPDHFAVKEVVLPFDRLDGSNPILGPEMKSTGEVMGIGRSFGEAYRKAQDAANRPLPSSGVMLVNGLHPAGLERYLTAYEGDDAIQAIRDGTIDLVVADDAEILRTAVEEDVTYLSTQAAVDAAVESLDAPEDGVFVEPVSQIPRTETRW